MVSLQQKRPWWLWAAKHLGATCNRYVRSLYCVCMCVCVYTYIIWGHMVSFDTTKHRWKLLTQWKFSQDPLKNERHLPSAQLHVHVSRITLASWLRARHADVNAHTASWHTSFVSTCALKWLTVRMAAPRRGCWISATERFQRKPHKFF